MTDHSHHHHPPRSAESHDEWNNRMAIRYNPDAFITKTGFLVRWVEAMRLERGRTALDCQATDAVLDLGCGPGNLLERLVGKRVVGADLSEAMLDIARRRMAGRPEAELVKADAENLPFSANEFDKVICSEVLEHVQDPVKVIREIHRVTKPTGRVVLTFPNEGAINFTKRIVLALGLKKVVAGGYDMSDDMREEWHRNEISPDWLVDQAKDLLRLRGYRSVPFPFLAYHRVMAFDVKK